MDSVFITIVSVLALLGGIGVLIYAEVVSKKHSKGQKVEEIKCNDYG